MKSAPSSRAASDGNTQVTPPSKRRKPSRTTGRRNIGIAQLALTAEGRCPVVRFICFRSGTIVATAVKEVFSCVKVEGKCLSQNFSRCCPLSNFNQKTERAIFDSSRQSMPAASAAPTRLPALVPAITVGLIPASDRALITPMCARPRTAPPLKASPMRRE